MDESKFHLVVSKIKELAIELGKTPTKRDLVDAGISHHLITQLGGVTPLVKAAGLDTYNSKKVDASIFEKSIETHLESYTPTEKVPYLDIKFTRTIVFGDLHFPFTHEEKLKKAQSLIEKFRPARIIQVGDLYDMLSHGKFPRSMNTYTPKEEMAQGRKGAESFWNEVRKLAPKAELHQVLGNHDIRPMKRIIEAYPEAEIFMDFEKWFKFDGVQTHSDIRQELILDGIAYIHGYKTKLGDHMDFMRRPVVCGHSHRGGVFYKNYGDATLFELNAGYLGDPESKALSYTAQKFTHWTHGVGIIDELGPRFVPL